MSQSNRTTRAGTGIAGVALAVLASGCSHAARPSVAASPSATSSSPPGQAVVRGPGVDLTIERAVAHLDSARNGTLTMVVHNNSGVPEHLDMVATPDAGRGSLTGAVKSENGALTDGGILLPAGSTVTFGGSSTNGPTIGLAAVHGITAAHTLPLFLQFGVARLVRLSAVVAST